MLTLRKKRRLSSRRLRDERPRSRKEKLQLLVRQKRMKEGEWKLQLVPQRQLPLLEVVAEAWREAQAHPLLQLLHPARAILAC